MKTTFGKLVNGAVFMYGSRKMYKKGSDKGADYGTSGKSERFSANVEVEIENAVETVPFSDRATPAQISYMKSLGIAVTDGMTKRAASAAIDAAKRGDGVGSFGMFYSDGSN